MAKSKAASASDAASKRKAASSHSSTRMMVVMAVGAIIAVVSSVFYQSFNSEWTSTLSGILSSAPVTLEAGQYTVVCKDSYDSIAGCSPPPFCSRGIHDDFLGAKEVSVLRQMAELGMSFGRGSGGPTIFDVVSGAASKGEAFVDAYALLAKVQDNALTQPATASAPTPSPPQLFTPLQISLYRSTMSRVKDLLETSLNVTGLHLTSPSFFSRITAARAITTHDEYWHEHVDKLQYGSFAYTALIYLSTQGRDFEGGDFVFTDTAVAAKGKGKSAAAAKKESRIKPQAGRLAFFTSGSENTHYVSPVTSGTRHALTIAFTCDPAKSVEASLLSRADAMVRKQAAAAPKRVSLKEVLEQQAATDAAAKIKQAANDEAAASPVAATDATATPPDAQPEATSTN